MGKELMLGDTAEQFWDFPLLRSTYWCFEFCSRICARRWIFRSSVSKTSLTIPGPWWFYFWEESVLCKGVPSRVWSALIG